MPTSNMSDFKDNRKYLRLWRDSDIKIQNTCHIAVTVASPNIYIKT
jgi:hypothetical protein